MIEAIFIVINGAYAYSRQYAQQADPTMLSGLLTALRVSSKEVSQGEFRQAQFGESQVVFETFPGHPGNFVAVFASPTEGVADITGLAKIVCQAFVEYAGSRLDTWTSLDGPFEDFQPILDQIVAVGQWRGAKGLSETPHMDFAFSFTLPREPVHNDDTLTVTFTIHNGGDKPVTITAIGNALPEGAFAVTGLTGHVLLRGTIFLHNAVLKPNESRTIPLTLKARRAGQADFAPILHGVQSTRPFTILGPHRKLDVIWGEHQ
jgi:hypothetical protein